MKCFVVIQTHPDTGEKHVEFSTNPLQDHNDLILTSGRWAEAPTVIETIILIASSEVCSALGDNAFRSYTEQSDLGRPLDLGEGDVVRQIVKAYLEKEIMR